MKKLITISAFALALVGCNTPNHIEGRLSVKAPLSVNTKNGRVTLPAAVYKTSLALKKDGGEVRIHTGSGRVKFPLPKIKKNMYGSIDISASELRQAFALKGKIAQGRQEIDRTVSQACVHHYSQDYQCRDEQRCVRTANGQEVCGTERVCEWVQVPVYGTENVHQQGYQDSKNVVINLVKDGKSVGAFSGGYDFSEKITSSRVVSDCSM